MRALRHLSCAVALVALLVPTARAQDTAEAKRLTILTFSEPVQLPGTTLPAGSYRFEIADINNAPHTVRVLSEDGQKVFGTFSTMPSTLPQRDLQDQNTLIMFAERPAGQPQAAREWYYPGRSIGEEFIYPREQAQEIADANDTSVAASDDDKVFRVEPESDKSAASERAAAAPASAARESESTEPVGTSGQARPQAAQERQLAQAQPGQSQQPARQAQAQQNQPSGQDPARTLPRTASQLGLFQLLGGVSLAAAIGVRRYRLRSAVAK